MNYLASTGFVWVPLVGVDLAVQARLRGGWWEEAFQQVPIGEGCNPIRI